MPLPKLRAGPRWWTWEQICRAYRKDGNYPTEPRKRVGGFVRRESEVPRLDKGVRLQQKNLVRPPQPESKSNTPIPRSTLLAVGRLSSAGSRLRQPVREDRTTDGLSPLSGLMDEVLSDLLISLLIWLVYVSFRVAFFPEKEDLKEKLQKVEREEMRKAYKARVVMSEGGRRSVVPSDGAVREQDASVSLEIAVRTMWHKSHRSLPKHSMPKQPTGVLTVALGQL